MKQQREEEERQNRIAQEWKKKDDLAEQMGPDAVEEERRRQEEHHRAVHTGGQRFPSFMHLLPYQEFLVLFCDPSSVTPLIFASHSIDELI